jgi:hypothetical protein
MRTDVVRDVERHFIGNRPPRPIDDSKTRCLAIRRPPGLANRLEANVADALAGFGLPPGRRRSCGRPTDSHDSPTRSNAPPIATLFFAKASPLSLVLTVLSTMHDELEPLLAYSNVRV